MDPEAEQREIDREIALSALRYARQQAREARERSAMERWQAKTECDYSRSLCVQAAALRAETAAQQHQRRQMADVEKEAVAAGDPAPS